MFDFITKPIAKARAEREALRQLAEGVTQLRKAAIINAQAQLTELDVLTKEYRLADDRYREALSGTSEAYAFKCWLQWRAADARFFKQVPMAHEANIFLKRWKPEAWRLHLVAA